VKIYIQTTNGTPSEEVLIKSQTHRAENKLSKHKFLKCKSCGSDALAEYINFGQNPISTNYKSMPTDVHVTYKLSIAICGRCATVQLFDHIPESELTSPPTWIHYNEPELHLDAVVSELIEFIDSASPRVRGLSYKDQSTITRLERLGYKDGQVYDFSLNRRYDHPVNIERLQNLVTSKNCSTIKSIQGEADVLLVRHVLEHTFNTFEFLAGIKTLVSSGATIIFEVPDCSKQFENQDYTCLWEEHTIYFVKNTFERLLEINGFTLENSFVYEYATENSLVAICKVNEEFNTTVAYELQTDTHDYQNGLFDFKNKFNDIGASVHNVILKKTQQGQIVIFGAGHLSITFIHLFNLKNLIDFVIDDDPNKCGKFMPGTNIEIRTSKSLVTEKVETCFLSLSPETEAKLLSKKKDIFQNIPNVKSIFPGKENSILWSDGHGN